MPGQPSPQLINANTNNVPISGLGIATAFGLVPGIYLRVANPVSGTAATIDVDQARRAFRRAATGQPVQRAGP